ncbi:MAG: cellulase family glycosylhydrolase [Oscillospiraceae bacterium]|nr:cellulase family glycosylhydrolase [Oscillospiraceae bacterium]
MTKKYISVLAGITAMFVGVSGLSLNMISNNLSSDTTIVYAAQTDMRDISSAEIVKDMGLGWNLGNTFDCIGSWIQQGPPSNYETAWGNPVLTKSVIQQIKAEGFKTVRIPTTWTTNLNSSNQINSAWMARIKEVVDWCMDEDLYVIINLHHDGGADDTSWIRNAQNDYASTEKKYSDVWTQISNEFRDYSDKLIFESMNEVEFSGVTKTKAYELLNSLNQKFVDTVRSTGSNNAKRHLLISGYNTDIAQTCDSRFAMPSDPANRLILSIHYYTPSQFCVAESDCSWCTPQTVWGSNDDYAELENNMQKLYTRFVKNGVPIIIGEYGVLTEDMNQKDKQSIRKYLSAVSETSLSYGMCPVLWDSGNSGDMKFFDRLSNDFYDQGIEDVYTSLSKKIQNGEIVYKDVVSTVYEEHSVNVPADGWIDISPYSGKKLLGVRFKISCSTDWDGQGGGGINNLDDWNDCEQFGFNSVYDTVEYLFKEDDIARMKNKIGIWFWWTILDDPNNDNSGHQNELSFKDGKVTLLFETKQPVVTTTTTTTTQPTTTTTTTTTQPTTTTTATTTQPTTTTTLNPFLYGDVTQDGVVDMTDLTTLSLYLLGDIELDEIQMKAADVTGDSKVNLSDMSHFKQYLLKEPVTLGPQK